MTENTVTEFFPVSLSHWSREGNFFQFFTHNQVILSIEIINARIIRFRYNTEGFCPEDFSYAIDEKLSLTKPLRLALARESTNRITLTTEHLSCRIQKENLAIKILDRNGKVLCDDEKGFHWEKNHLGSDIVKMSKKVVDNEQYFGLGDKSSFLNLRGQRFQNWCTDCFGYGADTDPLYRAIPFYYGLRNGIGYGIFFDNTFRTFFDFASERSDVTSFWAHGGEMNYYFIYGPSLMEVAEGYTQLTGTCEMPPMWALGYHQCRWSYYPESRVRELADNFRRRKIPCDALYLDIDYMDGYRCFTWNNEHFPKPAQLIRDLDDEGFRTVVIIDPGIKIDPGYEIFDEGLANDYFCRRTDGPYVKGNVWPGECYFPDFTNPEVRNWWSGLFRDLIRKDGVSGVWNDMNEPALFDTSDRTVPHDVRHDYDGNPCSHRKAHNIYGMQMSRATYEGVKRYLYPERPFMITRASYSGGQRFASVWTGDNTSSWEHLRLANLQSQRLSVSGFSFVGSDIGGFNDLADGELFVRWLQCAIFHPLCRAHTMGDHGHGAAEIDTEAVEAKAAQVNSDQEPWSFGEEYEAVARKAIEFRYQILPLIYTAFWQHIQYGTPIIRPLAFLDHTDHETYGRMDEFSLGDHLLVCPVLQPESESRKLYLPHGKWFNYYTSEAIVGGQEVEVATPIDQIPLFVRAGAVLPLYPVRQHTQESIDELMLHVYPPGTDTPVKSLLYEDEGNGYEYQEGRYKLKTFEVSGDEIHLKVRQTQEGSFQPTYVLAKLFFHALPFHPTEIRVDQKVHPLPNPAFHGDRIELAIDANFEEIEIR